MVDRVVAVLSIKNNFLFIHYPKTGGTSVRSNLQQHAEKLEIKTTFNHNGVPCKHAGLGQFKRGLPPDVYARLFKFSIIRNPWERMISFCYWYRDYETRRKPKGPRGLSKAEFLAFLERARKNTRKANNFKSLRQLIRLPPARHTSEGVLDADVDYLMRYENLAEDFAHVCKQIGIAPVALPHVNETEHEHYSRYYDDELVALVAERYQEEIAFGGYQFEWR